MNNIRLISVIVPAHNEEALLPGCLASLKNQDYAGEYEVIVADNGSTDNTADIARRYGSRVITCSEQKGAAYARQAGADIARGDIIIQADADTIYPGNWLGHIASRMAAHPGAVAVAGIYIYRDKWRWATVEHLLRYGANRITGILRGRPIVISGANFAFRRSAFLACGGYHGLTYSADQYGISSRLARLGKIIYDPKIYVLTSARRVQKPDLVIIKDFLTHISLWVAYNIKTCLSALRGAFLKAPRQRRIVTTLLPALTLAIYLVACGYFTQA